MSDDTPAAGSGGEGSGTPDTQAPEVRALIREAVDQEVAGLKATNANLKDEKRALAERVKTADGRIAELETLMQARDEQLGSLVVDDRIRDAAAKAGLIASATEDALHRGRQVFALDREGRAVARDGEGAAILGADGKSPLSPAEWLEGMRETAPHWWPPSSGAGAPGAGSAGHDGALSYEQAGQLSPERYARLRRDGKIT
jgi:hypothetical protein